MTKVTSRWLLCTLLLIVVQVKALEEIQIRPMATDERELLVSLCTTNDQCLHDGVCTTTELPNSDDGGETTAPQVVRHCVCPKGIGGSRCESYCPIQCENGGYCRHVGDGLERPSLDRRQDTNPDHYECKCQGRLTGKTCNIPYQNCGHDVQCLHGGQCENNSNDETQRPTCSCPPGYGGDSCEIEGFEAPNPNIENDPQLSKPERISLSMFGSVLALTLLVVGGYWYRRRKLQLQMSISKNIHSTEIEQVPILRRADSFDVTTQPRWKNIV